MEERRDKMAEDTHLMLVNSWQDKDTSSSTFLRIRVEVDAQATIFRLPTEILVLIFEYLALPRTLCMWRNESRVRSLSGVCKHWREVILDTPSFWTVIKLPATVECIRNTLARSRTRPLYVCITSRRSTAEELDLVFNAFPRIRCLEALCYDLEGIHTKPMCLDAPYLQTLDTQGGDSAVGMVLIQALRPTPSLQSVKFDYFHGCWQALRGFTGLRCLKLRYPTDYASWNTSPTPVGEVINCLRLLTLLENVEIHCSILSEPEGATATRTRITLPYITDFTLDGRAMDCAELLAHLELPSVQRVDMRGVAYPYLEDAILGAIAMPVMSRVVDAIRSSGQLLSLSILANVEGCILLNLVSVVHQIIDDTDPQPSFECRLLSDVITDGHILAHIPPGAVQKLSLELFYCASATLCRDMNRIITHPHMCHLEELCFESRNCMHLPQVLEVASEPQRWPRLRTLTIYAQRCRRRSNSQPSGQACLSFLEEALRPLVRSKRKPERLSLYLHVPLDTEQLGRFAAFAENVEVHADKADWGY